MELNDLTNVLALYTQKFMEENNNRYSHQQIAKKIKRSKTFVSNVKFNRIGKNTDIRILSKIIDLVVPEEFREQLQASLAIYYLDDMPLNLLKSINVIAQERINTIEEKCS